MFYKITLLIDYIVENCHENLFRFSFIITHSSGIFDRQYNKVKIQGRNVANLCIDLRVIQEVLFHNLVYSHHCLLASFNFLFLDLKVSDDVEIAYHLTNATSITSSLKFDLIGNIFKLVS